MKTFYLKVSVLIILSAFIYAPKSAQATHMAGGYFYYRQFNADSVKITLVLFRDCAGISMNPTPSINIRTVGVTPQKSANVTMTRVLIQPNIDICKTFKNICSGGTFPFGLERHYYEVNVNLQQVLGGLSSSYCRIKLSFQECCLNGNVTNITAGNFYLDAEFNRCLTSTNRSPVAQNLNIPLIGNGVPISWNPGLTDTVDYDSVSYHSIPVYSGDTTINAYTGSFNESRPLQFLGFPNPAGFRIDPVTGDLAFVSTAVQQPVLSFEFKEYRNFNGTYAQIGYTRMVFTMYAFQATPNNPPSITIFPVNNVFSYNVNAGSKICISYLAKDRDTLPPIGPDTTHIEWTNGLGSGATFENLNSYANNSVQFDSATVCWTPDILHARNYPYYYFLKIADDNCSVPGFLLRSFSFRVLASNVPRNYINNGNRNYTFRLNVSSSSSLNTQWVVPTTGNAIFDTTGATTYNSANVVNSHGFSSPGRYVIRVRYTFAGTTYTYFDTVNVCNFRLSMVKDTTVCIGSPITLQPQRTGGSAPFRYQWNSGSADTNLAITKTPIVNTKYIISVRDSSNCEQIDSVVVRVNRRPFVELGINRTFCFNDSVRFQLNPYKTTYLWNDSSTASLKFIRNPGTYWVRATNSFGCSSSDTVVLTRTTANFTINAGLDKDICIRDSVQIGANASGSATVSYLWSPATGLSASNISMPKASPVVTTSYTVTVTDSNNCRLRDTVVVNIKPYIPINFGADRKFCFYDSVILDGGAGAASYLWQNTSTNRYFVVNGTGTYYVRNVHPTSNCAFTDTVVLQKTAAFTYNAGPDRNICPTDTVTIGAFASGAGNFTYQWTPATGLSSALVARPVASPANSTTYAATATDSNACFIRDSVRVNVSGSASLNFGADRTFCFYDSVRLDGGAGAASYLWQNNSTGRYFTVYNTGTYWCVSTFGNCTRTDTVVLTKSNPFTIDAGANSGICAGDSITIGNPASGSTGWFTYNWTPTTGLSSTVLPVVKAAPLVTSKYFLTATDTFGCFRRDSVTLTVTTGTAINLGADRTFCFYDSVRLDAGAGASSYLWQNNSTGRYFTVTNTGTYWCQVTNGSCTRRDSVTLTRTNPFALNAGPDRSMCIRDSVTIGGQAAGTGSTFTYRWSPVNGVADTLAAMPKVSPATSTNYLLTATDTFGCFRRDSVRVNVHAPQANAGLDTFVCIGDTIRIGQSASGRAPLTIRWSPNYRMTDTTILQPRVFPLVTTPYILTVIDSGGCVVRDTIVVTASPLPLVNAGADATICEGDTTLLFGQVSAAVSYAVSWSPATRIQNSSAAVTLAYPISTTSYVLNVTDLRGCKARDTVRVTVRPKPVMNFPTSLSVCNTDTVFIGDTAISGNGPFNYLWLTTGPLNLTAARTRFVVSGNSVQVLRAEDIFGCIATRSVSITAKVIPTNVNAGNDTLICAGASVRIGRSASGNGLTYLWTPSTGLSNPTILLPTAAPSVTTAYVLTVTNNVACKKTDTIVVNIRNKPIVEAGINRSACAGDTLMLNGSIQANGSPGPFQYQWSPATWLSSTQVLNPVCSLAGTVKYMLTVSDSMGCSHKDSVTLTFKQKPVPSAGADKAICTSTQRATLFGFGASSYYWSLLSSPNTILDSGVSVNVQPPQSTTYLLKATNPSDGRTCIGYDTVNVFVSHLTPVSFSNAAPVYCSMPPVTDMSKAGAQPVGGYWYTSQSVYRTCFDTITKTVNLNCLGGGTHYVNYVYRQGLCTLTDSVLLTVTPPSTINTGVDKYFCHYDQDVQLQTVPALSGVNWSVSPSCAGCIQTSAGRTYFRPYQAQAGTSYKVLATFTNSAGCVTRDSSVYHVKKLLNADFSGNPLFGNPPLLVSFDNLSSIPNGLWDWNFGDIFNPGTNTANSRYTAHWYTQPGAYTVSLLVRDTSNGITCADTATKYSYINIGFTGTTNPSEGTLAIYPNPSTDGFTIVLPVGEETYELNVFDVTGKSVFSSMIEDESQFYMHRGTLASGVYLVRIRDSKNKIFTAKHVFR